MSAPRAFSNVLDMNTEYPVRSVEVGFVGNPPLGQIERASGVSGVESDGRLIRCLVTGSFQPFLEALRGHEVTTLQSTPVTEPASHPRIEGDL